MARPAGPTSWCYEAPEGCRPGYGVSATDPASGLILDSVTKAWVEAKRLVYQSWELPKSRFISELVPPGDWPSYLARGGSFA